MKRIFMPLIIAAAAALAALSGCSSKSVYTGEYSYTQYGTNYGIRVQVAVDGGKISGVKLASSDLVSVSEPQGDWTEEDANKWKNGLDGLLKAYEGKTVDEVLSQQVAVSAEGAPLSTDAEGFREYDSSLIISGSTLGSGRLLLAVQNALREGSK